MVRMYRVRRGRKIEISPGGFIHEGIIVELEDEQATRYADALEPVFPKAFSRSPSDKMLRSGGYMKKGMGT